MNLLRRIAALPGLRRLLLAPRVRRFVASLLALRFLLVARRVTTPAGLLRNEIVARGQVRTYTVRATGVPVALQHGRDLEALFELFERGEYDPSPVLRPRLEVSRVRRVLDVGANVGTFSAWATGRWPGAAVVAFEPSEESITVYRQWLAAAEQAGFARTVELVEAAAGTSDGEITFTGGLGGGSRAAVEGETGTTVPVVDLYEHLAGADLVKMDIEGGEWPILQDPRLATLRDLVLVMEYHRNRAPSLPAGDAARDLLERAGFDVEMGARNYWGHGILWAWRD